MCQDLIQYRLPWNYWSVEESLKKVSIVTLYLSIGVFFVLFYSILKKKKKKNALISMGPFFTLIIILWNLSEFKTGGKKSKEACTLTHF